LQKGFVTQQSFWRLDPTGDLAKDVLDFRLAQTDLFEHGLSACRQGMIELACMFGNELFGA
jgi:hypothetical protein